MRCLVTGGCGFIGSNVAAAVLQRGHQLFVVDSLARHGSSKNLEWLGNDADFTFSQTDIRDRAEINRIVAEFKPEIIFHFAGQVAMTTSLQDPRADFEINAVGGHNLLEAVRTICPTAIFLYSSTNKVYGSFDEVKYVERPLRYDAANYPNGFDENMRLDFQSPYGCSKGVVDQYALDYARMFNLNTVVFRHSSVFGGRQFSTFDQGWVGWFIQKAMETAHAGKPVPFTVSGDGKQVRDILFIDDLIRCYFSAIESIDAARGQAFNIGGGPANSLSLLELFAFLESEMKIKLQFTHLPWRQSDQKVFIADVAKASRLLGWKPEITREQGLRKMIRWMEQNG